MVMLYQLSRKLMEKTVTFGKEPIYQLYRLKEDYSPISSDLTNAIEVGTIKIMERYFELVFGYGEEKFKIG